MLVLVSVRIANTKNKTHTLTFKILGAFKISSLNHNITKVHVDIHKKIPIIK